LAFARKVILPSAVPFSFCFPPPITNHFRIMRPMPYALFTAFGCDGVGAYGAEPFLTWGGFGFVIINKSETHGGFPFSNVVTRLLRCDYIS